MCFTGCCGKNNPTDLYVPNPTSSPPLLGEPERFDVQQGSFSRLRGSEVPVSKKDICCRSLKYIPYWMAAGATGVIGYFFYASAVQNGLKEANKMGLKLSNIEMFFVVSACLTLIAVPLMFVAFLLSTLIGTGTNCCLTRRRVARSMV